MGLAVHIENQIHEREYLGSKPGKWLAELLEQADPAGQLATVGVYGDTNLSLGFTRTAGHDVPLDTDGAPLYFQAVLVGPADCYGPLLTEESPPN